MKPEEVRLADSAKIQDQINDKVAEMEDKKTELQRISVELQELMAKLSHARADEFRKDIRSQQEAIARGQSPRIVPGRIVGPAPEHN